MKKFNIHPDNKIYFYIAGFLAGIVGLVFLVALPFSSWTDSNLEFWLSYMKGSPVEVPLWISFLLTMFFNVGIILANIFSELLRLVL